ncbi:hypothetical protein LUZ60_006066 [Juncus effusus]|nr:hypothetical protein LUZ60_006066 [Juncus effusus]
MGTFHDLADNFPIEPLKLDPKQSPCFDLKVFYMKLTNFESTPNHLKVNHIPLNPSTVLKANSNSDSDSDSDSNCLTISLRRDRVDRSSEESTYISTDTIRITNGGVHFEVLNGDELFLFGQLEPSDNNKWGLSCQLAKACCKNGSEIDMEDLDLDLPKVEVYIAGCFEGNPVILTKSLDRGSVKDDVSCYDDTMLSTYRCYKPETDIDSNHMNFYSSEYYTDYEENGTLSWFNAGVRVGVGIGLGIFVGFGIGVGVLVQSYQSTTRSFKRRLV